MQDWPTHYGTFDGARSVQFNLNPPFHQKWKVKQSGRVTSCLLGAGHVVAQKASNKIRIINDVTGKEVLELKGSEIEAYSIFDNQMLASTKSGLLLVDLRAPLKAIEPEGLDWLVVLGELNPGVLVCQGCLRDSATLKVLRPIPIRMGRYGAGIACGFDGNDPYNVACFDVGQEKELWRTKDGTVADPWTILSVTPDFTVLFSRTASRINVVSSKTGEPTWKEPLVAPCQSINGYLGFPCATNKRELIFASSVEPHRNALRSFDLASGVERWIHKTNCVSAPILLGSYIAVTECVDESGAREIRLRSIESGEILWSYPASPDGCLVAASSRSLVLFSDGHLQSLSN